MIWFIAVLAITFVLGFLGTKLVWSVTQKKGWVAHPTADRWHKVPTSLHGGVAIFMALSVGGVLWLLLGAWDIIDLHSSLSRTVLLKNVGILSLGVSISFLVGLLDDVFHLRPGLKLLGQLLAVSFVIFLGFEYNLTPYPWLDVMICYLWFIGIMNAVNLLDNMDGISSGIVIIGSVGVSLIGIFGPFEHSPLSVFVAAVLCFSILGFWLHNKPPAKIFMGDSGSLVIGFLFAAITIPSELNGLINVGVEGGAFKVLPFLVAVTLAAIPILDTSLVTVTRLMRGQSPSVGGKDHSTHRLAHSGLSAWQTSGVLYGVSALNAVVAMLMVMYPDVAFLVFGGVFLTMAIVAVYLASVSIQVDPIKKEGWQQLVASFTYRIPLVKMVFDVVLVVVSFQFAYLIRFDFQLSAYLREAMFNATPIVISCCLLANFLFKVYDFSWRSASSRDVLNYGFSSALGTVLSIAIVTLVFSFGLGNSRGAYVIFSITYFLALTGSRFSFKFLDDILTRFRLHQTPEGKIPLLLYGSNRYAKAILDEIIHDLGPWAKYRVVGLVDSTDGKAGKVIQGLDVKPEKAWVNYKFASLPEILVVDDSVENTVALEFARKLGENIRTRRFTRKIVEIS